MNPTPTSQQSRVRTGKIIFVPGAVITIVFLIWGKSGVYASQLVPFLLLGALGMGAMVVGGRMTRDPNKDAAVDWKRTPPPE